MVNVPRNSGAWARMDVLITVCRGKIGLINFNMHFLLKKFELALIFSFTNLVVNLSLLCPF